jgi:hypothetical protein
VCSYLVADSCEPQITLLRLATPLPENSKPRQFALRYLDVNKKAILPKKFERCTFVWDKVVTRTGPGSNDNTWFVAAPRHPLVVGLFGLALMGSGFYNPSALLLIFESANRTQIGLTAFSDQFLFTARTDTCNMEPLRNSPKLVERVGCKIHRTPPHRLGNADLVSVRTVMTKQSSSFVPGEEPLLGEHVAHYLSEIH